jgi:hypothetical protein
MHIQYHKSLLFLLFCIFSTKRWCSKFWYHIGRYITLSHFDSYTQPQSTLYILLSPYHRYTYIGQTQQTLMSRYCQHIHTAHNYLLSTLHPISTTTTTHNIHVSPPNKDYSYVHKFIATHDLHSYCILPIWSEHFLLIHNV